MPKGLLQGLLSLVLLASALDPAAAQAPGPGEPTSKEIVRVRLVTLDVMVVDRKGRTVPGLPSSEFNLVVDGRPAAIDTLDEACPGGAIDSPRGGKTLEWSEPAGEDLEPRRMIFVFDYLHLPLILTDFGDPAMAHTTVLKQMARTLRALPPGPDEIMVAVLDGGLRVEQTFTKDRQQVLATLARMEKDVTLFAGHFSHISEKPLFGGLSALIDVVETTPGSKALVLFTGGDGPSDSYDRDFRELRDHASLSRVAIYPVDCSGLGRPFR